MALKKRLPGYIAKGLMIVVTTFWVYWGVGEMYHEGWWGAWYNRLPYLVAGTTCLSLTLVALTWPRVGGWTILGIGLAFSMFWWGEDLLEGHLTLRRFLGVFPLSGSLMIIGGLFLLEARFRKHERTECAEGAGERRTWWQTNIWYVLALVPPLLVLVGFSAFMLPIVLSRVDDGDRSTRLIEGNGITLVWAPEGPGWNWKQPWGGYLSWQRIALYGMPPVGVEDKPDYDWRAGQFATSEEMAQYNLCLYLSADGLSLLKTPQNVWRMPTVDEYVRSFTRHGQNAGCVWQREIREQVQCDILPDKETPLWAPDLSPIYYWAADEYNERRGYFVSYNGFVNATLKISGNPRHSYRCVRDP